MALQTDSTPIRQIHLQPFRSSRNETPLRERVSPKLRIQSELRGSIKMPPILSPINNTAIQSNKSGIFSTSKTPLRKGISKPEGLLPRLEENVLEETPLRSSKFLSVETNNEPNSFVPFILKDHVMSPAPQSNDITLYAPNPLTNKSNYSIPMSTGSLVPKFASSAKGKSTSTRRHVNSKDFLNALDRRAYESNIASTSLERREFSNNRENPITQPIGSPSNFLPLLGPTRCSTKHSGVIKAYAANTNQGLVRDYNEDRVAIILNIMRPHNTTYEGEWPMCSFFGIYDGHGGAECADFLRDNLHQFVLKDRNFPGNPVEALKNGFEEAERRFTEIAQRQQSDINRSGSCAIVALMIDDMCYIANVGDSRGVMSCEQGKKALALSRDHKPNEDYERERITANGGKVYQTQITQPVKQGTLGTVINKTIFGPHRVFPGRLSVSRTFGDIEAKLTQYGGLPGVVVAAPEIVSYKFTKENDFILLGCDGIFDVMNDEDVVRCIWDSAKAKCDNVHQQSSVGVESILNEAMIQKSLDNITAILITLDGFNDAMFPNETPTLIEKGSIVPSKLLANIFQKRISTGVSKLQALPHNSFKKSLISDSENENSRKIEEPFQENIQQMIGPTPIPLSSTWRDQVQKGEFNQSNNEEHGKSEFIAKKLNLKLKKLKY